MPNGMYLISQNVYENQILPNDYRINWDYLLVTAKGVLIHIITCPIQFTYLEKRD